MKSGDGRPFARDLYEAFVERSPLAYLALQPDGTIVYASDGFRSLLGRDPAASVGQNVVDWLHPDELERAMIQLAGGAAGVARGITRFNVAHHDGSWVPTEIWATPLDDNGQLLGICARDGRHQVFLEEVMAMLLQGAPPVDALIPVLHTVGWESVGSKVAIEWSDAVGHHQVNSGEFDDALGGTPLPEEHGSKSPWEKSRTTLEATRGTVAELDSAVRALAEEAGLESYWIEPVHWSDQHSPATVTIWTTGGHSTDIHSYGMAVARNLVELIMRWTEQVTELDTAARHDPLTGLFNRRAFFAELEQCATGGAVLYCDLDKFKPVNDTLGHAAGDELLRLVGMRMKSCLREGDILARLGGDEFAVLAPAATPEEGQFIADRIRAAVGDSFAVGETVVEIGISVGVAHNPFRLNGRVLEEADWKLGVEKAVRSR